MRLTKHFTPGVLAALFWLLAPVATQAQQPAIVPSNQASPAPSPKASTASDDDDRYRIGPGDVLDVKVFNKPQFDRIGVRVDPRGMIRMPLVKDEIRAACRTEEELEAEVTERLKEFIREPQVTVQIQQYQADPVAVLGAVHSPSRFLLQRRVRLLEMLTFVNGVTDNAGRTIQIVHTESGNLCKAAAPAAERESSEKVSEQIDYYDLKATLKGDEKSNPYVRAGDVISIAAADQIYVIGNVVHPTSIALTEPITVSRAIAIAGGAALDTKKDDVHIIRQTPGTTEKKEIVVDLDAINRHKAEDVVLVANDIVEVPASGGKRFFRSLVGAVIPNVATLPVRVIP